MAPDIANPVGRLTDGYLVGREHEIERMRAALDEALSGHGRIVTLAGETGIGQAGTGYRACRLRRSARRTGCSGADVTRATAHRPIGHGCQ